MGERQLRRLFEQHLGASPIAVAQTRRVLFAKQLIHDTQLSMAEVAMAAGFGSLRRFNDAFRHHQRPPGELRRRKLRLAPDSSATAPVVLHISYRPPYDWEAMLAYLKARAIDGMECVEHGIYRRTVSYEEGHGIVAVAHAPYAMHSWRPFDSRACARFNRLCHVSVTCSMSELTSTPLARICPRTRRSLH